MPNTRLAAVGAFVVGGILLFAVGLFLIGSRRMLFSDTFQVYAEFSQIAALDNGAKVRVSGMDAGEVEVIRVPQTPAGRFRVEMRVRSDLHQLLRLDSVASIQNDGLVGNKFVQIDAGTEASPMVPDKGTVQSREPFDIAELMSKMSDTIDTVTATIVDLKGQIDVALKTVSDTTQMAQDLLGDVGEDAKAILSSSNKVTADLQVMVAGIRQGKGSVGKLLTDDALYESAKKMAADAQATMTNVREASAQAKSAIAGLQGQGGAVQGLTGNLQQTLTSARDVMADMAETTEALKRNFLVRGFFNRRGYFDLADVSVQEYRRGVLEAKDRRALRLWIKAEFLFERDDKGAERLSEGGRARLDSAMSQFVRYPGTSPLVVEGYAPSPTADERFLTSRARAQLVRTYIMGKFGLDPNVIAVMPMGVEAEDSPDGKTWDGIGLALFVPTAVVRG
jgi:phospholipid/cholesterol/gamma-HCH transport system substrate-binding protein